ncbi:hypothetical protein [Paenibacillus spongiae]|uniref:Uncharacterized protein n=1 Tax=Paenibacillus spongiae TaxID=2909671 RepID=A0ABY5S702_9BACL|nr:hypothetical protein [Paenibacillus spongiae]UVI29494.1 hypothetical protein L1F29_29425 [Paenibacillus spongiae]
MLDLTIYGTVESAGNGKEIGRLDRTEEANKDKIIVPIDGETRIDAK